MQFRFSLTTFYVRCSLDAARCSPSDAVRCSESWDRKCDAIHWTANSRVEGFLFRWKILKCFVIWQNVQFRLDILHRSCLYKNMAVLRCWPPDFHETHLPSWTLRHWNLQFLFLAYRVTSPWSIVHPANNRFRWGVCDAKGDDSCISWSRWGDMY